VSATWRNVSLVVLCILFPYVTPKPWSWQYEGFRCVNVTLGWNYFRECFHGDWSVAGVSERLRNWSRVLRNENVDAKLCLFQIRVLYELNGQIRHPLAPFPRKQPRYRAVKASTGPDLQLARKINFMCIANEASVVIPCSLPTSTVI
jgi:hypothetical protein